MQGTERSEWPGLHSLSHRLNYVDIKQMDIKQLGTSGQPAVDNRRADKADAAPTTPRQPPVAQAPARQPPEVEVSAEAKAIGTALAKVGSQPNFDQAKVDRVKSAIEQGRYSVSAERVAAKLLRFEDGLKDRS